MPRRRTRRVASDGRSESELGQSDGWTSPVQLLAQHRDRLRAVRAPTKCIQLGYPLAGGGLGDAEAGGTRLVAPLLQVMP